MQRFAYKNRATVTTPRVLQAADAGCRGYIGASTDTTQQSGQTPDTEVDINHITAYASGYTETDTTEM